MRTFSTLFIALLAATPALAVEPRSIGSAKQIKAQQGAVRLSVQSQVQQPGTIHIWFLREGGDPSRSADVLKFERKQGVPLLGVNTIDSQPLVYSVPAGRYRLLAHGVKCPALPPEGTYACSVRENYTSFTTSAERYGSDAPTFEVVAGKLTDAGEFILEAPAGSPIGEEQGLKFAGQRPTVFQVRVRPTAQPLPAQFRALEAGPAPAVPPAYVSQTKCLKRPKGAMMYLPFTC